MPIKLRCRECAGPFGLTRHYKFGRAFCCKKCEDIWVKGLLDEIQRLQCLAWFRPPDKPELPAQKPPDVFPRYDVI